MDVYNIFSILYIIVIFALIVLFVVSFVFFIKRLLANSAERTQHLDSVEKKLDTIIELLKKENEK
ncbi:DUF4083 domain-containing protein [Priestia megaterium]|nr:DUF4083 domain-containing protein [Priestia megaterium]